MTNERTEYRFLWLIENYSYCWHKNGEKLASPEFTTDDLEGTSWTLQLYPRGTSDKYKGNISVFLSRSGVNGPESLSLDYELSVLAADGSALLSSELEYSFKVGAGYGNPQILPMEEVLLRRKTDYLPQDTLSVRCRMWKGEGDHQKVTQICARSRIVIEHISFVHVVDSFAALEPNKKKTVQIRSPPNERHVISSSVYITNNSCCKGKVVVSITPPSTKILSKCKLSLLDVSGNVIKCGEADNRSDASRDDIHELPLTLTRQVILDRKSEYLPDDKLSMLCECVFNFRFEYKNFEITQHEIPSVAFNQINDVQHNDKYNAAEKLSDYPSAMEDLRTMYNNQRLTDVELKTTGKSFPAHKLMLCARSAVFNAMLTSEMKEKNTDSINVDDLEDDTVKQLLFFLYSDNIKNLQWESAIKLYYAADKYAIEKLKVLCSSFLVDNLSASTASELLLFADTHNDSDLKKFVEDFILEHEEEVFGSDEWEKLTDANPKLVIKTMHLKYRRNRVH